MALDQMERNAVLSVRGQLSAIRHLIIVAALSVVSAKALAQSSTWNFRVFLDGKVIGTHHFETVRDGTSLHLVSEADFKVTLLAVPIYRYHHQSHQDYQDSCLRSIEALTDENGARRQVHGSATAASFTITTGGANISLPPCVMTFDYWDPRILQQDHLLNPQTGDYAAIVVTRLGPETIAVLGKPESARCYQITSGSMKIKLWYSADDRWLGLESLTPSGRLMRYELAR